MAATTAAEAAGVAAAALAGLDPLLVLNPSALLAAALASDALAVGLLLALALALYSFVSAELSGNFSAVDRLWSLAPAAYAWLFAAGAAWHPRAVLAAVLASLWGARLTYNFARKGGFSGEEDYRWPALRKIVGSRALFVLFDLTFIATYQHLLLLAFTLPAYLAGGPAAAPLHAGDAAVAALFLALVALETAADEQQWRFQQEKRRLRAAGAALAGDARRGFLTAGLFRFSRHPNFFAEQCIWWAFYLFSVTATGQWLNWTGIGAVLLTLLFQGSTAFTEKLSLERYPAYARYQKTTSRLLPWFPGPALADD